MNTFSKRTEIDLSEKRSECERSNANWDRSKPFNRIFSQSDPRRSWIQRSYIPCEVASSKWNGTKIETSSAAVEVNIEQCKTVPANSNRKNSPSYKRSIHEHVLNPNIFFAIILGIICSEILDSVFTVPAEFPRNRSKICTIPPCKQAESWIFFGTVYRIRLLCKQAEFRAKYDLIRFRIRIGIHIYIYIVS